MSRLRPLQIMDDGTALVPLSQGLVAIIDAADAEAVGKFNWHASVRRSGLCYARRNQSLYLHAFLTGSDLTDHKDGNPLNNRRSNLRPSTHQQNAANKRKYSNHGSRFKGVIFCKWIVKKQWKAQLTHNKKWIFLGYFATEFQAAEAYRLKSEELFGEFAVSKSRPPLPLSQLNRAA
jgi:hypothetical protein